MPTLSDFVLELSREPEVYDAFKRDQSTYINASELSAADKAVLLSGDPVRIREALTTQSFSAADWPNLEIVVVLVAVAVTTRPPVEEE